MKMLSTKQLNRLTCLASCRIVPSRMFRGIIKEEEYVKEAQYPEIPQYLSENEAEFAALKEQMRSLKTVEEKQLYLNKPKYYGWYSCVMDPNKVLPTSLDFLQFVTNTTIINDDLPNPLKNLENIAQEEAQRLEPIVKKHLLLQSQVEQAFQVPNDRAEFQEMGGNNMEAGRHSYIRKASEYKLQSLHRILHLHLSQNHPHLMQQTTGINPRVEAFWMRSGMQPDMRMVRKRRKLFEYKKKKRYPKDMLDEEEGKLWKEYDNALQIQGTLFVKHFQKFNDYLVTYLAKNHYVSNIFSQETIASMLDQRHCLINLLTSRMKFVNQGQKNTKYLNGITLQKQLAIPILINMEPMSPERGLDLLFLSSILHMSILSIFAMLPQLKGHGIRKQFFHICTRHTLN